METAKLLDIYLKLIRLLHMPRMSPPKVDIDDYCNQLPCKFHLIQCRTVDVMSADSMYASNSTPSILKSIQHLITLFEFAAAATLNASHSVPLVPKEKTRVAGLAAHLF